MPINPYQPPKEVNERPALGEGLWVGDFRRIAILFVLVVSGLIAFGQLHGCYVATFYGTGK